MSEQEEQPTISIPRWTPDFDASGFDVHAVLREAGAQKKSAYKVLKSLGYPVAKFISFDVPQFAETKSADELIPVTASSTAVDLSDDDFAESAIEQMQAQGLGSTIFLNHQYVVPEDVYGKVASCEIVRRQVFNPVNGEKKTLACWDLKIAPVGEDENPRAVRITNMLRKSQLKLGVSVTVLVLKSVARKGGGRTITDVFYIESSMVGIPCNQTAWAHATAEKSADPAGAYTTFSPLDTGDPASVERFREELRAWLDGGWLGKEHTEGKVMSEATQAAAPATDETAAARGAQTTAAAPAEKKQIERGLFKGLFQDEVDERVNSVSFIVDRLIGALYEWKQREADDAALDELLGEFTAAMKVAMARDENAEPYMVFYSLSRASFEQVSKSGARNSQADQALLVKMHDTLIELGVPCEKVHGGDGDAAAKSASVAALAEATSKAARLEAEVETIRTDRDLLAEGLDAAVKTAEVLEQRLEEEKATSLAAVTALERYGREPLSRAGVSVS